MTVEGGFTPPDNMADLQHALTCQEYKQAELVNNKAERDVQLADEMMGMYGETYDVNGNKVTSKIPHIPLIPDEHWE